MARGADDDRHALVRRLPAEALYDLVRQRGVSDCAEWLVAATPAQLEAVIDRDLWRSPGAGTDDRLDVARFGEWLESLVENSAATAAAVVSRMDRRLAVAGLSSYIRVFDPAALTTPMTDGEVIGGYVVQARHPECWDAIVGVLVALASDDRETFDAVMRGCRRLSDSAREIDGLDNLPGEADRLLHDLGDARYERRAALGFLTPAEARAFLRMAREPRDASLGPPEVNPIVAAYFRAERPASAPTERARPLLTGQVTGGRPDETGHTAADLERAFLVNALMAGCAIQARAFSPGEANEAVSAACDLGNELLPVHRQAGLVPAFQAGWAALYEASLLVGRRLVEVLAHVRTLDSQTQQGLVALRHELERCCKAGAPWGARDALDVLAILDPVGWTGVLGVLDECPVVTDALLAVVERRRGAVSATALTFVSSVEQLSTIRAFAGRLHDVFLGSC